MHQDFLNAFGDAFKSTVEDMFDFTVQLADFTESTSEFEATDSPGIASIVGFKGKVSGRCLLWFPAPLAVSATEDLIEESISSFKSQDVLFAINEINNMLSGNAITLLNNKLGLSLMLSPPSVFAGSFMILSTSKITNYLLPSTINQEQVYLNLAIEGSV